MEDARISGSDQNITAEDLWYIDDVEAYSYQCISCGVGLSPCSYDKDVNKRRPYFRKQAEHKECFYLSEAYLNRKGKKSTTVRSEDGKPGHYPREFALPKLLPASSGLPRTNSLLDKKHNGPRVSGDSDSSRQAKYDRPYKTSSFRLLVNHYLNYPNDRSLPLTAESIDGYNYWTCFKSLFTNSDNPLRKPKNKIYFANAKWAKPEVNTDTITILFDAYTLDESKSKRNLFLVINTKGWKDTVKEAFMHDYNKARRNVIDSEGEKRLKVFFLGRQSDENLLEFTVDTPLLISFNIV
ncbi:hypothetical protein [Bacterioplanoides sp.]|uniref:hypothetical protein n=1 Tax=Bacterioplanoides sp. TaxID=2066072 RepID=UPI003B59C91E